MRVAVVLALAATFVLSSSPADVLASAGKKASTVRTAAKTAAKKPAKKPARGPATSKKAPRKAGSEAQPADPQRRKGIAGQGVQGEKVTQSTELEGLSEVDAVLFPEVPEGSQPAAPAVLLRTDGLPAPTQAAAEVAPSDLSWMASLQKPDFPFRWDARLVKYLDYFKNNPKGKAFAAALIKKSGRYEKLIRQAARDKKLPEDLMWVSLVESGMNPRIVSPAGAAGLWQFMPKAGEAYGLRIDKWVDERLDPERSTQAGLKFLSDLHTRFGSWELAMAAYNMGHGGLLTAIRKYNTNDFWELSQLEAGIPYETSLYVPKIVALAFVARNKQVFGCDGVNVDPAEPYEVAVVGPGTVLSSVAQKTGASKELLAELNPQLLSDRLPPTESEGKKGYLIRVPTGTAEKVTSSGSESPNLVKHTVRWGESLDFLASSLGTTESKLRSLNGLTDWLPPRPGTILLLPAALPKVPPKTVDQPVAVVPGRSPERPGLRRVFYEVVHGDTMEDVSRVLGVRIDDLCLSNNLDRDAKLHSKMMLQAFVKKDHAFAQVRVTDAGQVKVLVVGSTEFFDHFEAKNGRMRMVITADEGDTFAGLSKRYGISVGMLERINHKPRKTALKSGEKVVVYTRRKEDPKSDIYDSEAREDLGS